MLFPAGTHRLAVPSTVLRTWAALLVVLLAAEVGAMQRKAPHRLLQGFSCQTGPTLEASCREESLGPPPSQPIPLSSDGSL